MNTTHQDKPHSANLHNLNPRTAASDSVENTMSSSMVMLERAFDAVDFRSATIAEGILWLMLPVFFVLGIINEAMADMFTS